MICPECQKPLIVVELDGVALDHCVGCGGVWLDAGELELPLHGHADAPGGDWLGAVAAGRRRCPMCRGKMDEVTVAGTGVTVDRCRRKHGIWLDKGELDALAADATGAGRAARLAEFCRHLFPAVPGGGK